MNRLLEYTLDKYQKRIDRLKDLKPNTVGYENMVQAINRLQDKIDQLRQQIAERRSGG